MKKRFNLDLTAGQAEMLISLMNDAAMDADDDGRDGSEEGKVLNEAARQIAGQFNQFSKLETVRG